MPLASLALTRFRNHAETRLADLAQFNLLVGENGAGKTNVLEALSLLAPGRGMRRASLTDMAQAHTQQGFAVSARLRLDATGDPVTIGTGTLPDRPGRRITRINSAEASAADLGEWFAVSWLTPAMDRLFADSAGTRRRFLDRLVVARDPLHARHASRYEAALRERNRLLGSERMPEARWFEAVEAQLAQHGALLAAGRAALVDDLSGILAAFPVEPFARPDLALASDGPRDAEALAAALATGRARDRSAARTLAGPHRDDLQVRMAGTGMPAAQCSTGEQKALLIAIVLAHLDLALRDRPGLLLLDEVAAHLDPVRRAALFERLRAARAQVWLTGTELPPFSDIEEEAAVWRVADGNAIRL